MRDAEDPALVLFSAEKAVVPTALRREPLGWLCVIYENRFAHILIFIRATLHDS